MNDTLIQNIQNTKNLVPQLLESYCIINRELMKLDEVQHMGYTEFSLRSKINMPQKLYKYFPNQPKPQTDEKTGKTKMVNYSIQALRDNTVFMQSPSKFDDVYDSDISLNLYVYERTRLLEYCRRCELNVNEAMSTQKLGTALLRAIVESFNVNNTFDFIFKRKPFSEIEELTDKNFIKNLKDELKKDQNWETVISRVILSDFMKYSKRLQNTFRTSCFATTPYSQLMWGGSYADCHRGFCVEYTILPNDSKYQQQFYNLFPMIYCKVRPDMTEKLTKFEHSKPTVELLWDIYFNGALRKSIDWAFQDEWRLLLPMKSTPNSQNYCVPFFPITKVFLGNRMSTDARKEIIGICHERNIPYVGMTRNPHYFEMQEYPIKCEECPHYTGTNIQK